MNDACIEILCDGGAGHGFGHLRRSAELGGFLKSRGYGVTVRALSGGGRAVLPDAPNDVGRAALRVVDLPYDASGPVREAHANGQAVLALDYHGSETPDLAICLFDVSDVPADTRLLSGLEYAIIRHEISEFRAPPDASGALIVIGGGDLNDDGSAAAAALASDGEAVTLVRGPLFRGNMSITGMRYDVVRAPNDLPRRMASCGWAVSNGGTTMLELMSLGKAVHVIPQTERERRFAENVLARGGLLSVGRTVPPIPDKTTRERVGANARNLVDGRGLERISDLIETLL